jgi:peptide/nickel transport system permease protein
MTRILVSRFLWGLVVVLGTATVAFIVLRVVPGDPLALILEGGPSTPALVAQIKGQYHLNDPLIVQYLLYLRDLLRGSLGFSIVNGQGVAGQIGDVLPTTLLLVAVATVIGVGLGIAGGLTASWSPWRWVDGVLGAIYTVLASLPGFWAALLLLTLFSFRLGWFPAAGTHGVASLVLPALTLALPVIAIIGQLVRDGMKEVMVEPYIFAARAKGVSEASVRLRHALRNALTPVLTATGLTVGSLITGAVVVEQIFARQGLGQLAVNGITHRDYPMVQGVVLVVAVAFVLLSIAIDVLHAALDPRVR